MAPRLPAISMTLACAAFAAVALFAARIGAAELDPATIDRVLKEAHAKFAGVTEGANADYIPALAKVPSKLFGIALVTPDGKVYTVGDSDSLFSIQSISKVFTMARVMQESGEDVFLNGVGVDATGQVFNSIVAVEQYKGHQMNPLVNPGAIATTGMVKGPKDADKWSKVLAIHEDFAGRKLDVNKEVYESEAATNQRNQAIARADVRLRPDQGRPEDGHGRVHAAVLDQRLREGPRRDGRHARQRRQESGHEEAGGRRRSTSRTSSR